MQVNQPYQDGALNSIYELLFCDDLNTFKSDTKALAGYPWNILLQDKPGLADLQKVIMDSMLESRIRLLACHVLKPLGQPPKEQILLGVIVEIGMDEGLDVLAVYRDGTARYINYTGRLLIWDTSDLQSALITKRIFDASEQIIAKIGPWNQPRKSAPPKGMLRISFLLTDGLYFGEGPVNTMFNDPMASPALTAATSMLKFITEKAG
jgi:hypothetical protein